MPRLPYQSELHARVRQIVADHQGKVATAARALEVDAMLLWRFYKSGSALSRNLDVLNAALDRALAKPAPTRLTKTQIEKHKLLHFSQSDVARLRGLLHHLVKALDDYEAQDFGPNSAGSDRRSP